MSTTLYLDVSRRELAELSFDFHRKARDIRLAQSGKSRLHQWLHTGSWSLAPVNYTADFAARLDFESLKFRLADMAYDANWWTEVPVRQTAVPGGPPLGFDYFFRCVVKNTNVTISAAGNLMDALVNLAIAEIKTDILFHSMQHVWVMQSNVAQPENTGYYLRFSFEGAGPETDTEMLGFRFGQFFLRLHGTGQAELWQTADFVNWGYVYSFPWALPTQVHGRYHRISIVPHARKCIEFRSSPIHQSSLWEWLRTGKGNQWDTHGGGVYEIPGEVQRDADGNFLITEAAPWAMRVNRAFRPMFQVSRIGYFDGGDGTSLLHDNEIAIPFPPTVPIAAMPDGDTNGGAVAWEVGDPTNGNEFVPDGTKRRVRFVMQMRGIGDLCSGLVSSVTPELYGYALSKPALYIDLPRFTVPTPTMKLTIDSGDGPEAERLTVEADNADGQLNGYRRRADIPIEVGDPATGVLFFEGQVSSVRSSEAPSKTPEFLEFNASGMAARLSNAYWGGYIPDFGKDPADPEGRGWIISDAIRRCFAAGGFDPQLDVVIEEEGQYLKRGDGDGFRFWLDGGSGGTEPKSGVGDGAALGRQGSIWMPAPHSPISATIDRFVKGVLGWHWTRGKDRRWHVYRRPKAGELLARAPRCAFVGSPEAEFVARSYGIPVYRHRSFARETSKPACSGVQIVVVLRTSGIGSKAELNGVLQGGDPETATQGQASQSDPLIRHELRKTVLTYRNPNCYGSGDSTGPDWLGGIRERQFVALEALTLDAAKWLGRNIFYNQCFGHEFGTWQADWGDPLTADLRKWDVVAVDRGPGRSFQYWAIDRIEPQWAGGGEPAIREARYRASLVRPDCPPPR